MTFVMPNNWLQQTAHLAPPLNQGVKEGIR